MTGRARPPPFIFNRCATACRTTMGGRQVLHLRISIAVAAAARVAGSYAYLSERIRGTMMEPEPSASAWTPGWRGRKKNRSPADENSCPVVSAPVGAKEACAVHVGMPVTAYGTGHWYSERLHATRTSPCWRRGSGGGRARRTLALARTRARRSTRRGGIRKSLALFTSGPG